MSWPEIERPSWWADARCRGMAPAVFFPDRPSSQQRNNREDMYEAGRRVCARCGARDACLEFAVGTGQRYGVFGGMSPKERDRLVRRRRRLSAG